MKSIDKTKNVHVIGDSEIRADLIFFNITGIDCYDNLGLIFKLGEHYNLTVRLETRKYAGGMEVIKELAAEFEIQLAAELGNSLRDFFGLHFYVSVIIEACNFHLETSFLFFLIIKIIIDNNIIKFNLIFYFFI